MKAKVEEDLRWQLAGPWCAATKMEKMEKQTPPKNPNPAETMVHVRGVPSRHTRPVGEEPRRRPQEAAGLEPFNDLTGVTKLDK